MKVMKVVVVGYTGSGKTTLVQSFLNHPDVGLGESIRLKASVSYRGPLTGSYYSLSWIDTKDNIVVRMVDTPPIEYRSTNEIQESVSNLISGSIVYCLCISSISHGWLDQLHRMTDVFGAEVWASTLVCFTFDGYTPASTTKDEWVEYRTLSVYKYIKGLSCKTGPMILMVDMGKDDQACTIYTNLKTLANTRDLLL